MYYTSLFAFDADGIVSFLISFYHEEGVLFFCFSFLAFVSLAGVVAHIQKLIGSWILIV